MIRRSHPRVWRKPRIKWIVFPRFLILLKTLSTIRNIQVSHFFRVRFWIRARIFNSLHLLIQPFWTTDTSLKHSLLRQHIEHVHIWIIFWFPSSTNVKVLSSWCRDRFIRRNRRILDTTICCTSILRSTHIVT